MNTEFAVEWKGFNSDEKRRLKRIWSRLQFPPDFCSRFVAEVDRGAPGEDGHIFIQAKDLNVFRQHWIVKLGFSSLEELVDSASKVVFDTSKSVWYCDLCGKPAPVGRPCGWCAEREEPVTLQ